MLPYAEITEPGYARDAAPTFTVENYGSGMDLLRGPCPRCQALIDIPVFSEMVKAGAGSREPCVDPVGEPVICTCEEDHEGRPAGRRGCGAYWNIVI